MILLGCSFAVKVNATELYSDTSFFYIIDLDVFLILVVALTLSIRDSMCLLY